MATMAQSAINWRNTHARVHRTHSLTHLHHHSYSHVVWSATSAITEFEIDFLNLNICIVRIWQWEQIALSRCFYRIIIRDTAWKRRLHIGVENLFWPNAMYRKLGLLSPAKTSSAHGTVLPSIFLFFHCFLCAVFLCFYTSGCEVYSFTTDRFGIFNVRTNLGACRTHKGESGTNKFAQGLTQKDRKTAPHPAPRRYRTQGLRIWILTL